MLLTKKYHISPYKKKISEVWTIFFLVVFDVVFIFPIRLEIHDTYDMKERKGESEFGSFVCVCVCERVSVNVTVHFLPCDRS